MRFLRATLTDGTQVVGEFHRLQNVQRYVGQVAANSKPFNAWEVVGETNPASGEPQRSRTRRMILGSSIREIEEVEPSVEDHGYDPDNFDRRVRVDSGRYGTHVFEEGDELPEGAVAGVEYPIRKSPESLRRYVILNWSDDEAQRVRHWLDPEPEMQFPGDADDDL